MATPSQHSQLLHTLLILAVAHLMMQASTSSGDERMPITLPGCPDKCGNIGIPYPFGMKAGCFLPGFDITCNRSFNPPRAFLNASANRHHVVEQYYSEASPRDSSLSRDSPSVWPLELVDISAAESQLRIYGAIRSDCRDADGNGNHTVKLQGTWLNDEYGSNSTGPFFLSPLRNALVGVGVYVQAAMAIPDSTDGAVGYMLACLSYIADTMLAQNGSCTGTQGCCQATFRTRPDPSSVFRYSSVSVSLIPMGNRPWSNGPAPPCVYGMVVDSSWYNFSTEDMYGYEALPKKYPSGVPFVLDFAVGGSCAAPQGTGCSGNSSCSDAPVGETGYVCTCLPFYQGNPYIPNGCQDINECVKDIPNPCDDTTICVNRELGYDCKCKPGLTRHGTTGPCTERFPLPAKIIVGVSALVVVSVLAFMVNQMLKLKKFYEQNGGPILEGVQNIRIYTRKQLKQMTNNYKVPIGEGAFGKVYLGTLKDKQETKLKETGVQETGVQETEVRSRKGKQETKVAVKTWKKVGEDTKQEFTDEVIIQSQMRHKNIVRLVGCCLQVDVPMLVYEYVANGSLYDFLFQRRESIPVDTRLKIAIGSAEGLANMHSAGEQTIRHGDVKSANILLDKQLNPKISDFGTSRLLARGMDEMTDFVIGDMGYIDPIYMEQGILTQKSDVYSFGIVLIELITRRPATDDRKTGYATNFVEAFQDNRARSFFDNDVTGEEHIVTLERISGVAVKCLKPNPDERLDMKQAEQQLNSIIIELMGINGESAQHGPQERNYQGCLSPTPDAAALLH